MADALPQTDTEKKAESAPVTAQPAPLIPDRKVWSGGLAMVVSWLILALLHRYVGLDLQPTLDSVFAVIGTKAPDAMATLAGLISWAVAYYVPPAQRDIIKRMSDDIVKIAQNDPASPVSPAVTTKDATL
jgi:hypothetical protein